VRLDIDDADPRVLDAVLERAGDTPAKILTASGKHHLLYRDNGERRLTGAPTHSNARPWDDVRVDLCGRGGYGVSPPSRCNGGEYTFDGGLSVADVLKARRELPTIRSLPDRAYGRRSEPQSAASIPSRASNDPRCVMPGDRNADMYDFVMRTAQRVYQSGGCREDVMAAAITRHAEYPVPHEDHARWVSDKVNWAWARTIEGKNEFGTGRREHTADWREILGNEDPWLAQLLHFLRSREGLHAEFWVSNGIVGTNLTGFWSLNALQEPADGHLMAGGSNGLPLP
jgi:hypothetical protein